MSEGAILSEILRRLDDLAIRVFALELERDSTHRFGLATLSSDSEFDFDGSRICRQTQQ